MKWYNLITKEVIRMPINQKKGLSFSKFIKLFSTEEACYQYLYEKKWPNGFVCPKCGNKSCYKLTRTKKYECTKCRHQTSLTARTVMHRSHLSLKKWFWAIYLVACDKRGVSALSLSNKIEVSYETAWYILKRIRYAMERRDEKYTLCGIIEFDDSYFGGKIKGVTGRRAGNQGVFIAISKNSDGNPRYLKMRLTDNIQIPSIESFVNKNLDKGSVVQTDGFRSYRKPLAKDYIHLQENFDPNSEHLKWLHLITGNAKAFINGTYHGTSIKHLQMYLSEFCYRFNRRFLQDDIFSHLVCAVCS